MRGSLGSSQSFSRLLQPTANSSARSRSNSTERSSTTDMGIAAKGFGRTEIRQSHPPAGRRLGMVTRGSIGNKRELVKEGQSMSSMYTPPKRKINRDEEYSQQFESDSEFEEIKARSVVYERDHANFGAGPREQADHYQNRRSDISYGLEYIEHPDGPMDHRGGSQAAAIIKRSPPRENNQESLDKGPWKDFETKTTNRQELMGREPLKVVEKEQGDKNTKIDRIRIGSREIEDGLKMDAGNVRAWSSPELNTQSSHNDPEDRESYRRVQSPRVLASTGSALLDTSLNDGHSGDLKLTEKAGAAKSSERIQRSEPPSISRGIELVLEPPCATLSIDETGKYPRGQENSEGEAWHLGNTGRSPTKQDIRPNRAESPEDHFVGISQGPILYQGQVSRVGTSSKGQDHNQIHREEGLALTLEQTQAWKGQDLGSIDKSDTRPLHEVKTVEGCANGTERSISYSSPLPEMIDTHSVVSNSENWIGSRTVSYGTGPIDSQTPKTRTSRATKPRTRSAKSSRRKQRPPKEFVVERIVNHREDEKDPSRVESMMFLVKWSGYGSEEDTWQSWDDVHETEAVERYAEAMGIKLPGFNSIDWGKISLEDIVGQSSTHRANFYDGSIDGLLVEDGGMSQRSWSARKGLTEKEKGKEQGFPHIEADPQLVESLVWPSSDDEDPVIINQEDNHETLELSRETLEISRTLNELSQLFPSSKEISMRENDPNQHLRTLTKKVREQEATLQSKVRRGGTQLFAVSHSPDGTGSDRYARNKDEDSLKQVQDEFRGRTSSMEESVSQVRIALASSLAQQTTMRESFQTAQSVREVRERQAQEQFEARLRAQEEENVARDRQVQEQFEARLRAQEEENVARHRQTQEQFEARLRAQEEQNVKTRTQREGEEERTRSILDRRLEEHSQRNKDECEKVVNQQRSMEERLTELILRNYESRDMGGPSNQEWLDRLENMEQRRSTDQINHRREVAAQITDIEAAMEQRTTDIMIKLNSQSTEQMIRMVGDRFEEQREINCRAQQTSVDAITQVMAERLKSHDEQMRQKWEQDRNERQEDTAQMRSQLARLEQREEERSFREVVNASRSSQPNDESVDTLTIRLTEQLGKFSQQQQAAMQERFDVWELREAERYEEATLARKNWEKQQAENWSNEQDRLQARVVFEGLGYESDERARDVEEIFFEHERLEEQMRKEAEHRKEAKHRAEMESDPEAQLASRQQKIVLRRIELENAELRRSRSRPDWTALKMSLNKKRSSNPHKFETGRQEDMVILDRTRMSRIMAIIHHGARRVLGRLPKSHQIGGCV